jgi:S1-C subfamily serine protease
MPARLRFRHLSGSREGEVDEAALPATLGSGPEAQVRVPDAAPRHALVFEREGEIVLQSADDGTGTWLDGESVRDAVLREGDVLQLGPDGPRIRLEAADEAGEKMLEPPPWPGPRVRLASLVARVRGTYDRTSPLGRGVIAAALLAGAAAVGWSYLASHRLHLEVERLQQALVASERERQAFAARVADERAKTQADRDALAARVEELQQQEQTLYARLADAAAAETRTIRSELETTRARLATLESDRAAGERIVRDYGPGVCLIHGVYGFQDKDGRPLRQRLADDGTPLKDADGNPLVGPEGTGPALEIEYVGTGFLVDRRGLVITNRHVAEPWWNDEDARSLAERGYAAHLTTLRAFFPGQKKPFLLTDEGHSKSADLAILKGDLGRLRLPVLPLDRTGRGAVAGQPVVVVGYPAGIEALLAKADAAVAKQVLESAGMNAGRICDALAERGLVRPSTTQGHIGDVTDTDIVFDAPTTQGGSGGPLVNRKGIVVGVTYAVLSRFGGSSFAVPIRNALPLLTAARRKKG